LAVFVAESIWLDQFARARRVLGRALVLGGLGALAIGTSYLLFGQTIGNDLFQAPALAAVTGLVAGWVVVMALQALLAEGLRGFQDIRLATVFGGLSTGVLLTAALGVIWSLGYQADLSTALLLTVGAGLASVSLAGWLLRRKAASLPSRGAKNDIGFGGIMRVALPLLIVNLAQLTLTQADLWIIGAFRPQQEVAIYGAAVRAVILVAMPLMVVTSVVSPLIAGMYAQGRRRELERILRAIATLAWIPAFLVLAGFALWGGTILGLVFGDYYREGATVLLLLSIGHLANVWVGACGVTLVMTGHQTAVMAITLASSLVMVIGGLAVVGSYGATGVAAAAATGVAICNISFWLLAKRKTGMWTHAGFTGLSDLLRAARRMSE
jgi:O-antigen/teichoic acid export membrane protein